MFSDILDAQAIQSERIPSIAGYIAENFRVGKRIPLIYSNGKFIYKNESSDSKKTFERGDLAVVRFVKVVPGYGVTVQLDSKTFGVIELSELTDDIT